VALVSDAGTPLISDPGFKLVRAAREAGHAVTALPGASAVLAALSVAGLPTDASCSRDFCAEGNRAAQAHRRDQAHTGDANPVRDRAAHRGRARRFGGGLRPARAAVCRELTKLHEEVRRGDLATLAHDYATGAEPRGEIVIVIAPPPDAPQTPAADLDTLLRQALARVSVKEAVGEIAAVTGRPRREVYQRALTLTQDRDHEP